MDPKTNEDCDRHPGCKSAYVDEGVAFVPQRLSPSDFQVAFIHAVLINVLISSPLPYDARPEKEKYIDDKSHVCFPLSHLLYSHIVNFYEVALNMVHQSWMAIPPKELLKQPGRQRVWC